MTALGKNVAVLLGSLLLALGAAELGLRVVGPPLPSGEHHELLCEHDPLLGWRKIPNARKRFSTSEYSIEERINAKGLRGPEHAYAKPPGVFRILALGDSFTEGYTVEFEELFSEVLARRLAAARGGQPVQVINAGTGGYSTDQELLFFRSEGHKYGADLVLLLFVDNDVWYNARDEYPRAAKPLFELRGGELVLVNTPLSEPAADPDPATAAPASFHSRIKGALSRNSTLYRFVRHRMKSTHWLYAVAIRLGLADAPADDGNPVPVPPEWDVFRTEPTPQVEKAWTMTEALLRTLRDEVEASGARLVVVNVPPSFDLYPDRWRAFRKRYGVSDETWSPSQVTRTLRAICARHGIELFDLTGPFESAIEAGRDRPEPLFFPIDGHWTARGHQLVGELLSDYVLAAGPRT